MMLFSTTSPATWQDEELRKKEVVKIGIGRAITCTTPVGEAFRPF